MDDSVERIDRSCVYAAYPKDAHLQQFKEISDPTMQENVGVFSPKVVLSLPITWQKGTSLYNVTPRSHAQTEYNTSCLSAGYEEDLTIQNLQPSTFCSIFACLRVSVCAYHLYLCSYMI